MYDFWYAMGVAVMRPALLDAVKAAGPAFAFSAPGSCQGTLSEGPTNSVRAAISAFLLNFSPSAPPVGVYCAGVFCQMMNIKAFSSVVTPSALADIVGIANTAYSKALGTGPEGQLQAGLPAALCVCLMDSNFTGTFGTPAAGPLLRPFGVNVAGSREWDIVRNFVAAPEFKTSSDLLLNGNGSPWSGGCREQLLFWDPRNADAANQ